MKQLSCKEFLEAAQKHGCVPLLYEGGVYLYSQEAIMKEQGDWDEADLAKDMDFSTCFFWVTTDDDARPQGINNADELQELIEQIESN